MSVYASTLREDRVEIVIDGEGWVGLDRLGRVGRQIIDEIDSRGTGWGGVVLE